MRKAGASNYINYSKKILNSTIKPVSCEVFSDDVKNMIKGDKIKILGCGHIYHYNCINEWFKRKRECPLCCK